MSLHAHALSRRGEGKIDVFQTVFVHGRTATVTIALSAFTNGEENGRMGVATAIITKASGRITGLHRIAFHAGTTPPSEALVLRRVRECAALASGVGVRSLVTAAVLRPPAAVATGLVLDPSSGRARRATPEATGATLRSVCVRG